MEAQTQSGEVSEDVAARAAEYIAELAYLVEQVNGNEDIALTLMQQIVKDRRGDQVNGK